MTEEEWKQSDDAAELVRFIVERGQDAAMAYRLIARVTKAVIQQIDHLFESDVQQACSILMSCLNGESAMEAWRDARSRLNFSRSQDPAEIAKLALYSVSIPWFLLSDSYSDYRDVTHSVNRLIDSMHLTVRAAAIGRVGSPPDWLPPGHSWHTQNENALLEAKAEQSSIVRCVLANRFRPVTVDPRWLSSTVIDLARTIYDERLYERMPILSDALMDAGCDNENILDHCRGPGPHVRGCWVVDLILGKE